jgi:hypothetical protein
LGKRKRADNGEEDELSPDREELVRSIEKSRRVVGTVSSIREEADNAQDELSMLGEEAVFGKSMRVNRTLVQALEEGSSAVQREAVFGKSTRIKRSPIQVLGQKHATPANVPQRTPIVQRSGRLSVTARQSMSGRSKSTDPVPATPSLPPNGRPRPSAASRLSNEVETAPAEESEDELSPQANGATPRVVGREAQSTTQEDTQMNVVDELSPQVNRDTPRVVDRKSQSTTQEDPTMNIVDELSPQANGATPRIVSSEQRPQPRAQEATEMDVDKLSSPTQPTTIQNTPAATRMVVEQDSRAEESASVPQPAKRGRPCRVVEDDDEAVPATAPTKLVQRGRPRKEAVQTSEPQATPAVRKPKPENAKEAVVEEEIEELDELSPDRTRTLKQPAESAKNIDAVEISSASEDSDENEEPEPEEEVEPTARPIPKRPSPKKTQRAKPSTEKPPRKRQRFLGPKHAISVMRIKGSAVRGITVADTTRTILEETIDHRLSRMVEKLQSSRDSDRRKELRSGINLSLSFKESLNEKLLDLQDANDVLSTNFKKTKLFRRDNVGLRKEILGLQNSRQEIAIEQDDVQTEYDAEKAKVDARNTLSDNMFEIEAAIKSGRDKARREGREDEGPEIPLRMLLETVGKDVGSLGGGLLANVKGFNRVLERAAGWLEGRA